MKHLGEKFILSKFEGREEIIRCNHADWDHFFRVTIPMMERKCWWPGMGRQVEAYVSKCDLCVRYAEHVNLLREWRTNPPPERPGRVSIWIDDVILPTTFLVHAGILNIQDDFSRFDIIIPVSDLTHSTIPYVFWQRSCFYRWYCQVDHWSGRNFSRVFCAL